MPNWIFLAIPSVISTLVAIFFTKRWIGDGGATPLLLSLLFFAISALFYMFALKQERVAVVEPFWGAASMILVIGAGLIVFGEKLNWQEWLGATLAVSAAILLATAKL